MSIKIKYAINNTLFNDQEIVVPYSWRIQDLIDHLCSERGFKTLLPIKGKLTHYLRPGQYISLYSKEIEDSMMIMKLPLPDMAAYPYVYFRLKKRLCIAKHLRDGIIKLLKPLVIGPKKDIAHYLRLKKDGHIGILSVRHPWYEDTLLHYGDKELLIEVKDSIQWDREYDVGECNVCLTSTSDTYLQCDVHHISVCHRCAELLHKCPTCRTSITNRIKVLPIDKIWDLSIDSRDTNDTLPIHGEVVGSKMLDENTSKDTTGKSISVDTIEA